MSTTEKLSLATRTHSGKGAARAVRRSGMVPGIIYGAKDQPELVQVDPRVIVKGLNSGHFFSTVFEANIEGQKESQRVLVRDVQFHPVSDAAVHFDLLRVSATAKINVSVPVRFINEETCAGIKAGGVLSIVRHEVELSALANAIPSELVCDLSDVKLGDTIKISSIELPENVAPTITDRDFVICNIAAPRTAKTEDDEVTVAETEGTNTEETE